MTTKEFKIEINADIQKVWFALWDDFHYRTWTRVFCEGSHAITDNWKEGSRVHFLTPDGKGMYSNVSANKPFQQMEFTHLGNIKNFREQELDEETKQWTGGKESYTVTENNGCTLLVVSLEVYDKFIDFFENMFPKALAQVKELAENFTITVQTTVNATIDKVWEKWNNPEAITKWYNASTDWHTPYAENDLIVGHQFKYRMEARDGSMGFTFEGSYTAIEKNKYIEYAIIDGRKVKIDFEISGDTVKITETFEPETINSFDLQRSGWQAILSNFKKYTQQE